MNRQPDRKIERRVFMTAAEAQTHAATNKIRGTYCFGTDSIVFKPAKESIDIKPKGQTSRGTREERAINRWNTQRFSHID